MKTRLLLALFICSMVVSNTSAQMPNYDGAPLEFDKSFVRKKVGDAKVAGLAEISGISCSRVTPGYLWAQGDDNYKIRAMKPDGTFVFTVKTLMYDNVEQVLYVVDKYDSRRCNCSIKSRAI